MEQSIEIEEWVSQWLKQSTELFMETKPSAFSIVEDKDTLKHAVGPVGGIEGYSRPSRGATPFRPMGENERGSRPRCFSVPFRQ